MRAARVACMAAMPRAISAMSPAKDSNIRGAPEDADDNPNAADGAGADGTGREADMEAAGEAMIGKVSGSKLIGLDALPALLRRL